MSIETELAWAAGLFDGEGCIHALKRQENTFQVSLGMVDECTVNRFAQIIGYSRPLSVQWHSKRNPKHNDAYYWRTSKREDILVVLKRLFPYLVTKRPEALVVINILEALED